MAETGERVLVVDDEPNLRRIVCRFLESRGFTVIAAENGKDALEKLQEQMVDLVLTDVYMPVLSGEELVSSISASHPHIPIVAMTGYPEVEKAVKLMRGGVSDYLRKPLQLKQLETVLRGALAKRSMNSAELAVNEPLRGSMGGYEILRVVGKGSAGIVYEVRRLKDGRQSFALKVLEPGPDEEQNRLTRQRFLREAEIARTIEHPNVVKLVDFGVASDRGVPYMVMEFAEGESLEELIERGTDWDYRKKTRVLQQIAEALAAIHGHHLCHRDIKPSNIIVAPDGQAKLTDFGLARVPDSNLTATHSVVGTPAYLAPESYREGIADARVDLFALGVLAYELYLGNRPFDSMVFANLVVQIEEHRPLEPRKIDPLFPLALQAIVGRLLKKKPAERYQEAAEVARDLGSWLGGKQRRLSLLREHWHNWRSSDWR